MKNKGISGMRIGFDNDRYLKIQSEHIKERINQFGDKLYLEFGGKYTRNFQFPSQILTYHLKIIFADFINKADPFRISLIIKFPITAFSSLQILLL